jgi:hypothetical protein
MKFGGGLELIKLCSAPKVWNCRAMSSWIKGPAEIFAIGRSGVLFLYLDMPEQIGRTQGAGEYCRLVCQWILYTWNDEIP